MAATGASNTYRPAIYRARGGKQFVIKATATQTVFGGLAIGSGGSFTVQSGGSLTANSGATAAIAGTLNVNSGGVGTVKAGGTFTFASGSASKFAGLVVATSSVALTKARSGTTVIANAADLVHTLPSATSAGKGTWYRFVMASGGAAAASHLKVRPQANDRIIGLVGGATDSEVLTLATTAGAIGDFLEVVNDGTNWQVVASRGTWTMTAAT